MFRHALQLKTLMMKRITMNTGLSLQGPWSSALIYACEVNNHFLTEEPCAWIAPRFWLSTLKGLANAASSLMITVRMGALTSPSECLPQPVTSRTSTGSFSCTSDSNWWERYLSQRGRITEAVPIDILCISSCQEVDECDRVSAGIPRVRRAWTILISSDEAPCWWSLIRHPCPIIKHLKHNQENSVPCT